MGGPLLDAGMAAWLGILTSISPCPLATNIAAISFVGRRVGSTQLILLSGLLYTLGRSLTYIAVALIVVKGFLGIPKISNSLQQYMSLFVGPIVLLTGIILLDIFRIRFGGGGLAASLQSRVEKSGLFGALLLGVVFALTFCPVSAALFFGGLIPLALKHQTPVMMPLLYGVGTALPVIAFAFLIAFSTQFMGKVFNRITAIEVWFRRVTAIAFLVIGVYLIMQNNFGWSG